MRGKKVIQPISCSVKAE